MSDVDVAVVGGGLAGSAATAMLARAGIDTVLIDPRAEVRPDFRCEKLDAEQVALLRQTGLYEAVAGVTTATREIWVARAGRLLDRKPDSQLGFRYHDVVNALRRRAVALAPYVPSRAVRIEADGERHVIELADGQEFRARLVVMANGLNMALRQSLAITPGMVSRCHSVSIGFDMAARAGRFAFPALTYFPERLSNRMAYLTLFPIGEVMRANLFVYRAMDDPWLAEMRRAPHDTLSALLPRLGRITGAYDIVGNVQVRPVDLVVATGHERPGVVLVGDAFSTSCPAAGTGAFKALTDVTRLCSVHIPRWLASPGMDTAKIAAFYHDPVRVASEDYSREKAFRLRSMSTDPGPAWAARRAVRFWGRMAIGMAHRAMPRAHGAGAAAATGDEIAATPASNERTA